MKHVYELLWKHPKAVLAFFLLVSLLLAYPAARIRLDSSVEGLMLEDDPDRAFLERVRDIFGNDEILVVAVVGQETIFRPESLRKVKRISDAMEDLDGVERVISLTTVHDILPTAEGIEVKPVMEEIPEDDEALRSLERTVLGNDLFSRVIVSEDGRTAAVNIFVESRTGEETYRQEILKRLQEVIGQEEGPEAIHLAGVPYNKIVLNRRMQGDLIKFVPLTVLLVAATLFVSFGTIRGVAIPLVAVGLATVWTMGVMNLVGKSVSVVSTTLPSLILAVGSAYTIHIVAHYYESVAHGRVDGRSLSEAFATISIPVATAALTTMAGFGSIVANPIPALRDFGIFGMIGILSSLLLSLLFAPAILAMLKPTPPGRFAMEGWGVTESWLKALAGFNLRHRTSIIAGSVILLFAGLVGIGFLKVDTDYIGWLKRTDPVIHELNEIERRLAGSALYNIVLEGEGEDVFKDPEVVRSVESFETYLRDRPWVDKVTSYVDYLRWIYGALTEQTAKEATLPDTAQGVSQSLLLYSFSDSETLDQLVSSDFSKVNVMVRAKNMPSNQMRANVQEIEEQAENILPPNVKARMTGTTILLLKTADQLVLGQLKSLSIALMVIFVMIWGMFLSLKFSLVSLIPNVAPIGILFGIMGWGGITLNTATSVIASVTLGIAVDDTIHYLHRFRRELQQTYAEEEAMRNALVSTGKPMSYTTLALCLGLLILCLSDFMPILRIGSLSALTLGLCLLADMILLPAVLLTTKIVTLWDLLLLKLGKDMPRTIRLFEGMRPSEANLLVLMGMVKKFKEGETVIEKGERGDEVYFVVSGTVEVFDAGKGEEERVLAVHRRGDVFGKMDLIRDVVWSESLRAKEDAELFLINEAALARIQRDHPNISSCFFLNLAKIERDRTHGLTSRYPEAPQGHSGSDRAKSQE